MRTRTDVRAKINNVRNLDTYVPRRNQACSVLAAFDLRFTTIHYGILLPSAFSP